MKSSRREKPPRGYSHLVVLEKNTSNSVSSVLSTTRSVDDLNGMIVDAKLTGRWNIAFATKPLPSSLARYVERGVIKSIKQYQLVTGRPVFAVERKLISKSFRRCFAEAISTLQQADPKFSSAAESLSQIQTRIKGETVKLQELKAGVAALKRKARKLEKDRESMAQLERALSRRRGSLEAKCKLLEKKRNALIHRREQATASLAPIEKRLKILPALKKQLEKEEKEVQRVRDEIASVRGNRHASPEFKYLGVLIRKLVTTPQCRGAMSQSDISLILKFSKWLNLNENVVNILRGVYR